MARLAADVKMGFYPTPLEVMYKICEFLCIDERGKEVHVLDPCCGEGEAISFLGSKFEGVKTYGIEPDEERFSMASNILDYVIHGSIFDVRINPLGSMGLLWLNPPYSSEGGDRTEMKFLRHSVKWLCDDGVLVFIVPEHLFNNQRNRNWISVNFKKVSIFRFPEEEFKRFKQVVLFGIKGRGDQEIPSPPYPEIPKEWEFRNYEKIPIWKYIIPSTEGPKIFQSGGGVTVEEIEEFRPRLMAELRKLSNSSDGNRLRPLLPLRKGHLVALLTAGMLDGKIETPDGGFILVKGFSDRITTTWIDEDTRKEITKNTYSVGIRVMEQGGKWYDIR